MKKQEIIELFNNEFGFVKDKFNFFEFALNDPNIHAKELTLAMPGVYVFWKNDEVIRVVRSLSNSRKRALEHIQDNTAGWMKEFENDPDTYLFLFNLKDNKENKNFHWAAALEIYFELKLKPIIPSKLG